MKHFTIPNFLLTLLLCITATGMWSNTAVATEYDPGTGRLSGDVIDTDFYDSDTSDTSTPVIPLNLYGSSKTKSPYTSVKYTHQSQFDGRTILHGIDVSRWQGKIDWKKVKANGIDYAFIQVGFRGYGSSGILNDATKDPYFDINMQNAIAAGIQVGVYVFSQATTEAEAIEEADYILDAIGSYPVSMPLVMDFEYASTDKGLGGRLYKAKLSKKKATNICMAFCKEIAAAGYTPMVYANKSMLEDQLNASTLTNAGYRIWLANYTKKTSYAGTFDFWQYSEKGKVKGIDGNVDMNFYYVQEDDDFTPAVNSISHATFTEVADQAYTGNPILPDIEITMNGIPLTPNVDYTISYRNNTSVGTAVIQITGIGNYCDTRNIRFDILPNAPTTLKAKKRAANFITLSWKKDTSITGYEIYRATAFNGSFKRVKTITKKATTSYKNTKLTAGNCYYYKIRSYKKVNGKIYYSSFSPVVSIYTKTGYTKNATTKSKTIIYDYIPGTKKETVTVTESVTDDNTTDTSTTADTTGSVSDGDTVTETDKDESATDSSNSSGADADSASAGDNTSSDVDTDSASAGDNTTTDNTSSEHNTAQDVQTVTKTVTVDSTPLIQVSKKTKLKVIYKTKYKKNTWYYVSYQKNGVTYKGYVAGGNVTITKLGKIVKTKKVNVRKQATVYSKKITSLKKNTKVDILSTKKKYGVTWYKVQFKKNNKTYKGWISSPYIKII